MSANVTGFPILTLLTVLPLARWRCLPASTRASKALARCEPCLARDLDAASRQRHISSSRLHTWAFDRRGHHRRRRPGWADAFALRYRRAHVNRCGASCVTCRASITAWCWRSRPASSARSPRLILPLVFVLELSFIPAFFLIKLWGRAEAWPSGDAVFCLHHGRVGGAAALVPRHLSRHGFDGLW